MNYKTIFVKLSNLSLTILLLVSCSNSQPASPRIPLTEPNQTTPSLPTPDYSAIKKIVVDAGRVEPLADHDDDVKTTLPTAESNDGTTRYTYEKHDVVDNIDSIAYLGLNDDIIWPGSLVRGDKAQNFVYEPIAVDRAPITLSISLEGSSATGRSITQQVDNPKLSTIRQGISDLLKKSITTDTRVPANVKFDREEVYNESQMNLFVGADISYGMGNLSTRFDWNSTTKKHKIIARYRQIYYSIDVDPPLNPADFFAPSMTATKLATAMPAGSRPIYIASVSYGMMALMFIETDSSEEKMQAALDAAYDGFVNVDVSTKIEMTDVLQNSNINIIVYGGSTAGLKDLETGYQGFKNVIEASSIFDANSPGVPLIYKFRHLSDNTLALITLTSQYTITTPIQLVQRVKITLVKFSCTSTNDGTADPPGTDNTQPDIDRLFFGYNAYNRKDINHNPGDQINVKPFVNIPKFGDATEMYMFYDPDYGWQPAVGQFREVDQSFYIDFDTDHYKFSLARIDFFGYANDYDCCSGDEKSYGMKSIYGNEFLSSNGTHKIIIEGGDVSLEVEVKIELIN